MSDHEHEWNYYYRVGLLFRVDCDVCGITPLDSLGELPIRFDSGKDHQVNHPETESDRAQNG